MLFSCPRISRASSPTARVANAASLAGIMDRNEASASAAGGATATASLPARNVTGDGDRQGAAIRPVEHAEGPTDTNNTPVQYTEAGGGGSCSSADNWGGDGGTVTANGEGRLGGQGPAARGSNDKSDLSLRRRGGSSSPEREISEMSACGGVLGGVGRGSADSGGVRSDDGSSESLRQASYFGSPGTASGVFVVGGSEEEPWPSLDDGDVEKDKGQQRVLDDSVVLAGRGALKAIIGGRHGVGGALSPARPTLDGHVENLSSDGGGASGGGGGGNLVSGGGGQKNVLAVRKKKEEGVLVKVMRFLSRLSDPRSNGRSECVLSLSLINIALEAGGGDLGRIPPLVMVMRGDLCKHLLQNSQTNDLNVLSLTLRVVFNLFNSIKDHLKVQLEVFLTR